MVTSLRNLFCKQTGVRLFIFGRNKKCIKLFSFKSSHSSTYSDKVNVVAEDSDDAIATFNNTTFNCSQLLWELSKRCLNIYLFVLLPSSLVSDFKHEHSNSNITHEWIPYAYKNERMQWINFSFRIPYDHVLSLPSLSFQRETLN